MTGPSPDDLPLAAEFPAATQAQWRKLVDGVLKGAPFDKRLVGRTYDGLAIEPLHGRAAQAQPVAGRAPGMAWTVTQRVDHPDPAAANAEAVHDLENGATGLSLVFAAIFGAYGYGLAASADAIARALDGVYLDAGIALDLDLQSAGPRMPGPCSPPWLTRRGIAPAATQHSVRLRSDRCGAATAEASPLCPGAGIVPIVFNAVISDLKAQGFHGPFAPADGRVIHNAGGSEAQELGRALPADGPRISARARIRRDRAR